jgi:hypothetical protein
VTRFILSLRSTFVTRTRPTAAAVREDLVLPDRELVLDLLDKLAAGVEGLAAVAC